MNKTISIIVEWENVIISDDDRALRMLSTLSHQIEHVLHDRKLTTSIVFNKNNKLMQGNQILDAVDECPMELLFLADPNEVDFIPLITLLKNKLTRLSGLINISLMETPELHYYDIKNFGGKIANGDYLLYLDSDVIPDSGWLENYIEVLEVHPEIEVLGGNAYIDPIDIYQKTFALTWFFDLQKNDRELYHFQNFKANNFIIKRSTFLANSFPSGTKLFRSQCSLLCGNMSKRKIKIFKTNASQVSHPAPNGFKHFYQRALAQGHDIVQSRINKQKNRFSFKIIYKLMRRMLSALKQLSINHKKVSLPFYLIPYALLIAWLYQLIVMIGVMLAWINPKIIRDDIQV